MNTENQTLEAYQMLLQMEHTRHNTTNLDDLFKIMNYRDVRDYDEIDFTFLQLHKKYGEEN
jgi:hypothetical protein